MARARELTESQRAVLNAIRQNPYRTSVREIANATGYSMGVVRTSFRALEQRGLVTLEKHKTHHAVRPRDDLFGGAATGTHWELRATPLEGKPSMSSNRQRRNPRAPDWSKSGGFAIGTYDQDLIEENARDSFSKAYGDPDARSEYLDAGFINHDGTPTDAGWDQLAEDLDTLESNALKWLRRKFEGAREEGHDKHSDLIGTFWYDPDNAEQMELIEIGIEERIDMVDASYGDLADTAFDGVSDFGANVLGGQINFFDVEGVDED